uniref:Uncharacterized protein n=1 Tax=Cucumis melo TaxID=3656 RepID=A0A9I9CUY0_CUCME
MQESRNRKGIEFRVKIKRGNREEDEDLQDITVVILVRRLNLSYTNINGHRRKTVGRHPKAVGHEQNARRRLASDTNRTHTHEQRATMNTSNHEQRRNDTQTEEAAAACER